MDLADTAERRDALLKFRGQQGDTLARITALAHLADDRMADSKKVNRALVGEYRAQHGGKDPDARTLLAFHLQSIGKPVSAQVVKLSDKQGDMEQLDSLLAKMRQDAAADPRIIGLYGMAQRYGGSIAALVERNIPGLTKVLGGFAPTPELTAKAEAFRTDVEQAKALMANQVKARYYSAATARLVSNMIGGERLLDSERTVLPNLDELRHLLSGDIARIRREITQFSIGVARQEGERDPSTMSDEEIERELNQPPEEQ